MLKTSGDEGVSIIKACMIEEDNRCESYRVDDVAVYNKVKEVFVNNTTRADDDHGETSSTLDLETWNTGSFETGNMPHFRNCPLKKGIK